MNNTQNEILTILQEECAEVIQAAAKIFRHGENNFFLRPPTNIETFKREIADLNVLILLAMFAFEIKDDEMRPQMQAKVENLTKYSGIFNSMAQEYSKESWEEFSANWDATIKEEQ